MRVPYTLIMLIELNLKTTMDSVSPWEFIGPSFESQYDKDQDENWPFTDKSHNLIIYAHAQTLCTDYFQ